MYNNFNIFVYYFNLIDNVRLLKWSLVAIKMECSGEEIGNFFWKARHLQDCAKSCVGLSTMFIYGTNDFGTTRCNNDGCKCFCETSATQEGNCTLTNNNGYRLYQYSNRNLGEILHCIINRLSIY